MIDYLNQFLFLYMVPFILSYLLIRRHLRELDEQPTAWSVILVVTPVLNWCTTFYFVMGFLFDLAVDIFETILDWVDDKVLKDRGFIKRFFRIKDEE